MRSFSPSAYPRTGQRHEWPGLPRPTACASRFSQPPGAFIRPEPAGPISYRIRSWGFALQSFVPLVQPYAVSDAPTLLTLLEGLMESLQPARPNPKIRTKPTTEKPRPTTSPTGSCSARESATYQRWFRPKAARGSPGLSPSRVFPLTGMARLSPRLPSWAWLDRSHATGRAALQGLASSEIGSSLSRPPTLLGFTAS
jgi:hypothetical protein